MRSGKDHGAGADGLEGKLLEVLMREEAETIREAVMQAVAAVVSSPAHPASVDEPQSPSDITWGPARNGGHALRRWGGAS